MTRTELLKEAAARTGRSAIDLSKLSNAELFRLTGAASSEEMGVTGWPMPTATHPAAVELGARIEGLELDMSTLSALDAALFAAIKPLVERIVDRAAPAIHSHEPCSLPEDAIRALAKDESTKALKGFKVPTPPPPPVVVIERPDGKTFTADGVHFQFEELVHTIANMRKHIYLWGAPGAGKSTAARQAAEAMGRKFGFISLEPRTPSSAMLGYMAPNTKDYHRTQFRECWEMGGVFFVDEIDNGSDSLYTAFNGALANGWCAFPDALVKQHEDFVVIAAGNTAGRGGNSMFAGRRALDSATLERFVFLKWEYDLGLEDRVVASITDKPEAQTWLTWVRTVRKYVEENDVKIVASPRAAFYGAEYIRTGWHTRLGGDGMAERVLFKGVTADIKRTVLKNCPTPEFKGV